jgi:uncharacterized protein YndB with AHSA1/START domain
MPDEQPADSPAIADTPATPATPDAPTAPAAPAAPAAPVAPIREVTRSVDIDAELADVWRAVADADERALWLDDPDALARRMRVDETTPGERLVWTWWHPGAEGDTSTVTVVLRPADGGGTRVVVTESAPALPPFGGRPGSARAKASSAGVARRSPSWVRCAHDRWDRRLLGLELLFVAARVGVA